MADIDVSQLYESGNKKFFVAETLANNTFGAKYFHKGLMEVSIEFSQEISEIGADDDPAFITLASPLVGEGTIKFAVLPYSIYDKFFDVSTDKNGAIVINSNGKPKTVAFGYYTSVGDGSESMFTLYRATFSPPSLNSVSFDGQTLRDLTLNVKINPFIYKNAVSQTEKTTYTIVNSELNKDIWESVQDEIYVPDAEL